MEENIQAQLAHTHIRIECKIGGMGPNQRRATRVYFGGTNMVTGYKEKRRDPAQLGGGGLLADELADRPVLERTVRQIPADDEGYFPLRELLDCDL